MSQKYICVIFWHKTCNKHGLLAFVYKKHKSEEICNMVVTQNSKRTQITKNKSFA